MACDTTHQRSVHRQAAEGAARLLNHPHDCICDCAVVNAVNLADSRRHSVPSPAADARTPAK